MIRSDRIRRGAAVAALAAALSGAALLGAVGAASGQGTKVRVGNLVFTASPEIAPRTLSKTTPLPVALAAAGTVGTTDGTHPPAPRTVTIEEDRNVFVRSAGTPVCNDARIQSEDTRGALAACRSALVGEGITAFEIAFVGEGTIANRSRLLIFNGGEANGVTTLLIHAFVTVPVRAAVVVPLRIRRVDRGRYGLLMTAQVPKIAGGAGSVTEFKLRFARRLGEAGKRPGVFSATCGDGRLQTRVSTRFADGATVRAELIDGCTPQG